MTTESLYGVSTRYDTFRCAIGTNWITRQFVEAAHESGKYKLTAVYSRSLNRPSTSPMIFCRASVYVAGSDGESDAIDAVYIASPNSLHFSQTQLSLVTKFM